MDVAASYRNKVSFGFTMPCESLGIPRRVVEKMQPNWTRRSNLFLLVLQNSLPAAFLFAAVLSADQISRKNKRIQGTSGKAKISQAASETAPVGDFR